MGPFTVQGIAGLVAVLTLPAFSTAGSLRAQTDPTVPRATLRGWAEETWLLLEDRRAVGEGRLSRAGILQRFHELVDAEFQLDLISSRFVFSDESVWYAAENGARYWTGSINRRDLVVGADVKVDVPITDGWRGGVSFDKAESPVLDRNLFRARVSRVWESGRSAFFQASFHEEKPEIDVTLGTRWRGERASGALSVTLLDAFNDVVFRTLGVTRGVSPMTLDYLRHPVAVRGRIDWRASGRVRVEGHGAYMTDARLRVEATGRPDSGFVQDERYWYAGGLVEAELRPTVRGGLFATGVRTVVDRFPLPVADPADDFRLVERTSTAGGFILNRPHRRWIVEGWVAREWRPERRVHRGDSGDVDYEDRSWMGQVYLGYRAPSGFATSAAFEWDARDVVRGRGQVPTQGRLDRVNTRLRVDVGWRSRNGWLLAVGYRADVDGDDTTRGGVFDGAHGRFAFYW